MLWELGVPERLVASIVNYCDWAARNPIRVTFIIYHGLRPAQGIYRGEPFSSKVHFLKWDSRGFMLIFPALFVYPIEPPSTYCSIRKDSQPVSIASENASLWIRVLITSLFPLSGQLLTTVCVMCMSGANTGT